VQPLLCGVDPGGDPQLLATNSHFQLTSMAKRRGISCAPHAIVETKPVEGIDILGGIMACR
jgi:hypothetical protein